jgi:hypothetical protein
MNPVHGEGTGVYLDDIVHTGFAQATIVAYVQKNVHLNMDPNIPIYIRSMKFPVRGMLYSKVCRRNTRLRKLMQLLISPLEPVDLAVILLCVIESGQNAPLRIVGLPTCLFTITWIVVAYLQLIHFDIKPANILLDHAWSRAKISDVGEAWHLAFHAN